MIDRHFYRSLKFKIISLSLAGVFALLITVFMYVVPIYRASVREALQHEVRASVEIAYSNLAHFHKLAEAGKMSQEEAQVLAKESIRAMRFNQTDYFFIYDFAGASIMHPITPEIEGQDRSTQKDPAGIPYLANMMAIATSAEASGFTEYSYPKSKDTAPIGKIGYVHGFKPWSWFVGSGVYQDAIDKQIQDFEVRIYSVFAVISLVILGISLRFGFSLSKKINSIVQSISASIQEISHTVEALSESGKHVAESSTSAAASLEETVASLEEVTSVVKLNSGNAQQASSLSQNSKTTAEQGEEQIRNLMSAMNEISAYSKKIEEIISVIDDIAFQTNLLALNAAVEAARAGEQGRGFAVVAEAVRSLASRSAVAAKDIHHLIKESVTKIEGGQVIADRSGEVLIDIVSSVRKVVDLNSEIAAASSEQTTGIHQINQAMNQLDQVVQKNSAATEEISAGVMEIAGRVRTVDDEARSLKKLVVGH